MSDIEKASITTSYESENADVALKFLSQHQEKAVPQHVTGVSEFSSSVPLPPKLLRKIDLCILPFLMGNYLFMFLDKALLNYAAALGIKKNLVGNQFSNLSTIFAASYIFGEPFVTFFIQRFRVGKTIGCFVLCWGIVLACHAACNTYAELMICRTLLGFFESSCAVGLIAVSAMYYTKAEQSARIGFWASMAGVGYIVGGLLSYGFQFSHSKVLVSWKILFLCVGCCCIVFGLLTIWLLPDNTTDAWFLTEEEKLQVLEHIRSNQTGVENKKFKMSHIKELFLKDKHTWPMLFLTAISQISTGCVGTFSVTVLKTFGFTNKISALLQLPIGVITIIIIVVTTQMIARTGAWTAVTVSMQIPSIVGCICLIALPLDNKYGNLFGLYLIYSGSCVITNIYLWNTFNTAGYTKRVFRNAATMIWSNVATTVAPQTFQAYSAPHYRPAKITLLVTQVVVTPLIVYIGWLSKKENEKRDQLQVEEPQDNQLAPNFEFMDMTDMENPNFRYTW